VAAHKLDIAIRVEKERRFFRRRVPVKVWADLNANQELLIGPLAEPFLRCSALPELFRRGDLAETINLRGRPLETFSQQQSIFGPPSGLPSDQEELWCVSGGITVGSPEHDSFRIFAATKFRAFKRELIVHALHSEVHSSLLSAHPKLCTIAALCRIVPLRIDCLRIGFELFESKFLGSVAGILPAVYGRFNLEVAPKRVRLQVEENLADPSQVPLAELVAGFADALHTKDLTDDFFQRVAQSL
jgi:hypothetical protein